MLDEQLASDIKDTAYNSIEKALLTSKSKNQDKGTLQSLIDAKESSISFYDHQLQQDYIDDETRTFYKIRLEEERLYQAHYAHYLAVNYPQDNVTWYKDDQLRNLYSIGRANNQQEFTQLRSQGFGGSDFRTTSTKLDSSQKIIQLIYSKIKEDNKIVNFHSGPLYRGHLLEPYIIYKLADKVRDEGKTIVLTKDTWQNRTHPSMVVNFDGLLSSDGGNSFDTLIECKTSTREEYWKDGIPKDYQFQVNYYLYALGLNKAIVAVLINGELKTYTFYRTRNLYGCDFIDTIRKLDSVYKILRKAHMFTHAMTPIKAAEKAVGNTNISYTSNTVEKYQKTLHIDIPGKDMVSFNPFSTNKRFVCLDFETSATTPQSGGKVIQAAAIIIDNGKMVEKYNEFFSISDLDILNGGLTSDVFTITKQDIEGTSRFAQSTLRDILYDEFVVKKSLDRKSVV